MFNYTTLGIEKKLGSGDIILTGLVMSSSRRYAGEIFSFAHLRDEVGM